MKVLDVSTSIMTRIDFCPLWPLPCRTLWREARRYFLIRWRRLSVSCLRETEPANGFYQVWVEASCILHWTKKFLSYFQRRIMQQYMSVGSEDFAGCVLVCIWDIPCDNMNICSLRQICPLSRGKMKIKGSMGAAQKFTPDIFPKPAKL